ncbi:MULTISPECIES: arginase family protein [unclassified Rhizobium]|uniref:arginase family protein n=1 Tax=unclassified Rhizobium TaxID=2613769 RepID=UPI0038030AB0
MPVSKNASPVTLIGLPYHCGTRGRVLGNAMAVGPEVLLAKENAPAAFEDMFDDVSIVFLDQADRATDRETGGDFRLIPAGDQMGRILVQNIHLAAAVRAARAAGRIPIVSAGTCSASLGVVGGIGDAQGNIGLVWFDAHGDALTPDTSTNGFIEGMLTTTIAGHCWPKYREQIPGFRVIPDERIISVSIHEAFSKNPRAHASVAIGTVVNTPVIAKLGFDRALGAALDLLGAKCDQVYVHVDTDVLDPTVLRANRHCADGGLTDVQVSRGFELIADRFDILAVSFSSFDPDEDERGPSVLVPLMAKAATEAARSKRA